MIVEKYTKQPIRGKTTLASIARGTVFEGKINNYTSRFFIKGYDCVVDLENPQHTWNSSDCPIEVIAEYPNAKVVLGEPK